MKVKLWTVFACLACLSAGYGIGIWTSLPTTLQGAGVYAGAKAINIVSESLDCRKQIAEATVKAEKDAAELTAELLEDARANAKKAQARLQNEKLGLSIELTNLYTELNAKEDVEELCKISKDHRVYRASELVRMRRNGSPDNG